MTLCEVNYQQWRGGIAPWHRLAEAHENHEPRSPMLQVILGDMESFGNGTLGVLRLTWWSA